MGLVGSDPSRPRVGVVHEGVGAADASSERQSVWRAALDVRHRPDVSSQFGLLCERCEHERLFFFRFFDRPGTRDAYFSHMICN